MAAYALALNLPVDFFILRHRSRALCTLRLLHYPPTLADADGADCAGERIRAGEHTDFGVLTLLFVDAAGGTDAAAGLQVRMPTGWADVTPPPDCVVVNTGALLAQWSNDVWRATPHRVVVTNCAAECARYSIAFFTDPDPEVLVTCLPQFCTAERPARYAPITSLDYLLVRCNCAHLCARC